MADAEIKSKQSQMVRLIELIADIISPITPTEENMNFYDFILKNRIKLIQRERWNNVIGKFRERETFDINLEQLIMIKKMMDACYMAKRARELLPELPKGVTPSYIHYLDIIQRLESQNIKVKISDISDELNLPRPGVTRTVKDMEAKGYLQKFSSDEDGRITFITLTEEGRRLSDKYDRKYYGALSQYLDCISDEDADCTIRTIEKLYEIMQERRINLE